MPSDLGATTGRLAVASLIRPLWRPVAGQSVLAVVAAQVEAAALVLVVPVVESLAAGEDAIALDVGPLSLDLAVTAATTVAAVGIVVAAVLNVVGAWYRSALVSRWEWTERDGLLDDFLATDWQIQAASRSGRLHGLYVHTSRTSQVLGGVLGAVRAGASVAIFLVVAVVIDVQAALAIVGLGLALFAALRPLSSRVRASAKRTASLGVAYGEELDEFAGLAREVRVFGAGGAVRDKLGDISRRYERARARSTFLVAVMSPLYQYSGLLVALLLLLAAGRSGTFELATMGAIAVLLLRSLTYGQQLQASLQQITDGMPYLEELEASRSRYRANRVEGGGTVLESVGELRFDDVSYTYDGETAALDHVDLVLSQRLVYGVVGPSGSGKSTLSALLLRLRRPTGGRLLVDGVDAETYSLDSWYRRVTFVPQEPRLFHGSVADNIAFLDPGVPRRAVEEAARGAGIHDLVLQLPQGYDTEVGAAARDLSGGQIQRIGIARALLRGASVLVLDEPTSALDVHSEAHIHQTLEALRGDIIVIVVAHRLSTLGICDRLVVLEDGRVSALGTPAEVLAGSEFFRRAMEVGTLDVTT